MLAIQKLVEKTNRVVTDKLQTLRDNELICSQNIKTGWSVNLPIHGTCRPTKVCARLCYGVLPGKPIAWEKSLMKQHRLLQYVRTNSPQVVADRIYKEYAKKEMTFIRWNGWADLIPETVAVI